MAKSFKDTLISITSDEATRRTREALWRHALTGPLPSLSALTRTSWNLAGSTPPRAQGVACAAWPLGDGGWLMLPPSSLHVLAKAVMNRPFAALDAFPGLEALAAAEITLATLLEDCPTLLGPLGMLHWSLPWETLTWFTMDDGAHTALLGLEAPSGPPRRKPAYLRFPFGLRLVAGFLPSSALTDTSPGDVLFTGWPAQSGMYFLGSANAFLPVRIEENTMTATGDIVKKAGARMPAEVVVEIGRLVLTGEELDNLSEGAVLPLGLEPAGQVTLVHDGRVVAQGELLIAGDELAVRILK